MKQRKIKIKAKKGTYEVDMGMLRAGGHIPLHYDSVLLGQDEELLEDLSNEKLIKKTSKPKETKYKPNYESRKS